MLVIPKFYVLRFLYEITLKLKCGITIVPPTQIKCMMRIAAEQQTPYVPFSDAVQYSFAQVGGKVARIGQYSP